MRLRHSLHRPRVRKPAHRARANLAIAGLAVGFAMAVVLARADGAPLFQGTLERPVLPSAQGSVRAGRAATVPTDRWATGLAGTGASAARRVHVAGVTKGRDVTTANRSPMWELKTSNVVQSVAPGDALLPLRAMDPDGDALVYSVSGGAFPGTILMLSNGSFTGTALTVGRYRTQVTVTDDHGAAASTVVEVSILNRAPQFVSNSTNTKQRVAVGSPLVRMAASDADAEPLAFELTTGALPPGVRLRVDGTFDGVAQFPGITIATIVARDPHGAAAAVTLTVTVEPSTFDRANAVTTTTAALAEPVPPSKPPLGEVAVETDPNKEVADVPITTASTSSVPSTTPTEASPPDNGVVGTRSRLDAEPVPTTIEDGATS